MGLTAAASGLVVLLSMQVVQGQNGWGVTYASKEVCAFNGSTVDMHCSYMYPPRRKGLATKVTETFWVVVDNKDLSTMTKYAGRVEYDSLLKDTHTLKIKDLRSSDSAEYGFRFITNQSGGKYTGRPPVTLTVTALQVTKIISVQQSNEAELQCYSRCSPDGQISYIWLKNEQQVAEGLSYTDTFHPGDTICCALKGHAEYHSPLLYPPTLRSVSVRPSGDIKEGISVTLTCSSDANPAAEYTWYKENDADPFSQNPQHVFSSIQASESGQYNCTATNKLGRTSSSITINVKYAPRLASASVNPTGEIVEGSSVNLTCSSDANPAAEYTWYKGNQTLLQEQGGIYHFTSIRSEDSGSYYCKSENQYGQINSSSLFVNVQYPPRLPSVSVSPSGEVVEGSSVTLTCSSDANPAAEYTWYKEDGPDPVSQNPQHVFSSIQASESGQYNCTATNKLGRTSSSITINVKYAPKLVSASASPSGEVVEGRSVTLTCSSDANPAAEYTWYKENQSLPQEQGGICRFTSIRSEDSGSYYCKSENQYGQINSSFLFVNVQYPPKRLSVSVSPSGEIVEGSSVNLTCSSDANPAANYTWYKEDEESPKASGQMFTITDFRPEHRGKYYCKAQNTRGRHTVTVDLSVEQIVVTKCGTWISIATTISAIFLAIILLWTVLRFWKKQQAPKQQPEPVETPDKGAQKQPAEQEQSLHYASIHFSEKPADPLYGNIRPARPLRHKEEEEEDRVQYAVLKFSRGSSAPSSRSQETGEDPAALYSEVIKPPQRHANQNL